MRSDATSRTTASPLLEVMESECELCRQMLEAFATQRHAPEWNNAERLPMANFVASMLQQEDIRQRALQTGMMMRVLKDTLLHCVQRYEEKMRFQLKRKGAALRSIEDKRRWSEDKCKASWRSELREMENPHIREEKDKVYLRKQQRKGFYEREFSRLEEDEKNGKNELGAFQALWQSMLNDEADDITHELHLEEKSYMNGMSDSMQVLVKNNMEQSAVYMKEHGVSDELFSQTWPLMGGRWNSVEFERMRKVAHLQRLYPQLCEVADLMGRKAKAEGQRSIRTSSGATDRMEHASSTDIVGVSMGNELSLLLPMELAQFADKDMENLFFEKYVTHRLQTFQHESQSLNSARSLHKKAAVPRGPMIVCVDQSGSMTGEAERMAMSLMMRLCEMCESQKRKCYLIAFTVQAHPIEVLKDRAVLLQFFSTWASGNTDARHMMDETFKLLEESTGYAGADVLWITDFRIPIPPAEYLKRMAQTKKEDCRWNGLQLGVAANRWVKYFDRTVQIEDIKERYW